MFEVRFLGEVAMDYRGDPHGDPRAIYSSEAEAHAARARAIARAAKLTPPELRGFVSMQAIASWFEVTAAETRWNGETP